MSAKVSVRQLRKRYGGVDAVRDVTFDVRDGEIFGLLGPNGAGKTTTVECVLGLREPDAGTIEVCGIDARRHPREVKDRVGAALQSTSLQDKLTPREALELFGGFYRRPVPAATLLQRFTLTGKADAPFETLSGGQRQRLALALAFVNNPDLVFLDEPTAGLDPQSRRELHGEIAKMKADGHTVLLTTHYIEEAEQLCDRIAIVDRGQVVAIGSPKELIAGSTALQTVAIRTAPPLDTAAVAAIPGATDVRLEDGRLQFHAADPAGAVAALSALIERSRVDLVELHVQKARLEDIFIEQTTRGAAE